MRNWDATTVVLERISQPRLMEDRWRWRVHIPADMVDGGLKATGANPSGTAMTRRGALDQARRAVLRVQEEDRETRETLRWSEEDWV